MSTASLAVAPVASVPPLVPSSRLSFPPLSIVAEGEEFLVGDPQSGVFLSLPEVGVFALRQLQSGATIADATAATTAHAGEDVDVLDFAGVLVEAGLVAGIDGMALREAAARPRTWLEGVSPELVRPFFSRPAWIGYGLVALFCASVFVLKPDYWPVYEDFFFYPNPAVCVVAMTLIGWISAACHELAHWLAGRAAGVAAQFSISRRFFTPVFETDLSQLWSVPRRERFSPFMAGMAFDTLVLALCLGVRLLWEAGAIDLPPLLIRLLRAMVLPQVFGLVWQGLVFLRTDLYAVLVTLLGCFNLYRVNQLHLKQLLRRLKPDEAAELAAAHPRDRAVARWFVVLYVAGVLWMSYVFVNFFIPRTVVMAGWMFGSLSGAPLGSGAFWQALTLGLMAALQALLPLAIWLRERIQVRKRVLA